MIGNLSFLLRKIMKKGDITTADRKKMMENIRQSERRCIYENDDILVMHSISHFPNDTSDAVMMVHIKKDGLLWRTETGSTPQQRLTDDKK